MRRKGNRSERKGTQPPGEERDQGERDKEKAEIKVTGVQGSREGLCPTASFPWWTHRHGSGHGPGLRCGLLQARLGFTDFSSGCPAPWRRPTAAAPESWPPRTLEEEKENPQNSPNGRQLGRAGGGAGRAGASLRDLIQGRELCTVPTASRGPPVWPGPRRCLP